MSGTNIEMASSEITQLENGPYRISVPDTEKCRQDLYRHLDFRHFDQGLGSAVETYLQTERTSHGESYIQSFERFAIQEANLSGRPQAQLVKASGQFDGRAKLGIIANYPTFATNRLENGECADLSNPCISMLLEKGLSPAKCKEIDLWDRWHRRESTANRHLLSRGQDVWWKAPDNVKELHEKHTLDYLRLSNPLVLLAIGRPTQQWIASLAQRHSSCIIDNVHIHVHRRDNQVERLVVECPHPETIFHSQSSSYGKLMDKSINFAIALSGINTCILSDYFTIKGNRSIPSEEDASVSSQENTSVSNQEDASVPSQVDGTVPSQVLTWKMRNDEDPIGLMVRMRGVEKATGEPFTQSHIPDFITHAYARKKGVEHTAIALQNTLKEGETICEAILRAYTAASHVTMEKTGWSNLQKATAVQAAGGWRSLKKAARNRMTEADQTRAEN